MSNQYIRKDREPDVLRWVKARERIPKDTMDVIFRSIKNKQVIPDIIGIEQNTMNIGCIVVSGESDEGLPCNLYYPLCDWEWLEEIPSTEPIEEDGKLPDPWFILKYVKTVLERGFPVEDIIDLITKKLHEYSCAASIPLKSTSTEEDGSEAYKKWLNDPQAELKDMPIADSKEVPVAIKDWIADRLEMHFDGRVDPEVSAEEMVIAMYHKMWELCCAQTRSKYLSINAQRELDEQLTAARTQIASLEAANKELGEQYAKASRTIDIYLNALEGIVRGTLLQELIAQQAIERQYSSL